MPFNYVLFYVVSLSGFYGSVMDNVNFYFVLLAFNISIMKKTILKSLLSHFPHWLIFIYVRNNRSCNRYTAECSELSHYVWKWTYPEILRTKIYHNFFSNSFRLIEWRLFTDLVRESCLTSTWDEYQMSSHLALNILEYLIAQSHLPRM